MADEQEVIDQPQIEEAPEHEEGPGPQSPLSEENRKKLDSIVGQMVANKESDDNIRKVVEDFKGKYSAPPTNLGRISAPNQKIASESTSAPKPVIPKVLPGTTLDRMGIETDKAHQLLRNEIIGNSDLIPAIIKKQKSQAAALQGASDLGNQPRSDQPLTNIQQLNNALTPKPQDPVVTTDDITGFNQNLIGNEQAARGFLHHVSDTKPEKAKPIQAAIYTSDAYQRIQNDPQKAAQVLQNAKKIEDGKLVYNIQGGHLLKPENAWESIGTGLKAKNKAFADYDLFSNSTPDQAITELEKRRKDFNPDEPTPVPDGFISNLTGGMASQPLTGLIAGKIAGGVAASGTSMIPFAQEFAPVIGKRVDQFVSTAVSSNDFRKMSYANALQKYYNQFRSSGMPEKEAYDKANGQAKDEAAVDAISGGAMMLAGGKIGEMELPKFSLSEGFNTAVVNGLKQGAKGIGEAGAVGLIQGTAQDAKNKLADMKGIEHDTSGKDIEESVKSGALFTLGIAVLAKSGSLISSKTRTGILQGLSKADPEQINAELGSQILEGHITPEEATEAKKSIDEHKELDESVPSNITNENRLKILDKIDDRKDLENQLETRDKAFHPEIKEKIKSINEDILELSKDKLPRGGQPELTTPETEVGKPTEGAVNPEPSTKAAPSLSAGDIIISEHLDGPQRIRSISDDGKTVFVEGSADHHVHEIPIDEITLKVKQNASSLRENKNGAGEEGDVGEGSQDPRSENIQLAQEQTSGNAETTEQAGEAGLGNNPPNNNEELPFEPESADVTRLAHKNTEELYEDLNTSGRIPRETKQDTKLESEADELIKNGYDFEGKANRVLDGDERLTDTEQVGFAKMVGALKSKLSHLDVADPEFDRIQDKIELLSRASDKAGSETGAALRARRMFVLNDQTLSDYLTRDKESLGVDTLTDEQKVQNKKEHEDIQQKQTDYDQKIKDLEEENAKLRAENELKKAKSGSKKGVKKSHEDYVQDRKDILKDAREALLRAAKGEGGLTASIPGAAQLAAIAPHVAKLVKSLVEEGVDKLEDVVKSIHGDLKDVLEGITEKDVHDIIAGEYNEKKATRNELAEKIKDLRDEAALINKLERLKNGTEPKSEKKKIERNKEITALKKQISDFRKENKDIESQLNTIKNRNESELKKIQEKLAKGDYSTDEKKIPTLENEEIKKKYPDLFKKTQEARDKLIKAKQDREIRLLKQQYAQRSKGQKASDIITEVGNTPRALMSSLDFSAPLRQGLFGVTKQLFSHPGDLKRQFGFMFKAAKSQKVFDRWFQDLKSAPDYEIMQKSGLPLSDPHDPKLTAKEEAFMSNYAEKIPVVGKLIKASENAYVGFLNKMRVDIFRRAADGFASNGKTFANSPELYKALADYVGAATGRGKMPEILEKYSPILSAALFSPRLIASRMNLLTNWFRPGFYTKVPREIRVQYFKDMAKFIGTGSLILGLAKMGGADVETDSRSPDFGKIKSGNTRWDIWGGFQQYVRLASVLLQGEQKSSTTGEIKELNDPANSRSKTRADVLLTFVRGKLAPIPAESWDFLSGKDVLGQPVTTKSELLKNLPLVLGDITQAMKDRGASGALEVGLPSMFGVGVQTYAPDDRGGTTGGSGAGSSYEIKQWK